MKGHWIHYLVAFSSLAILNACGSHSDDTQQESKKLIKGQVIDDAVEGAKITVYDANKSELVTFEKTTNSDGDFSIAIDDNISFPILLKVTDGKINGEKFDDVMYGVCFEESCNVTPVTTTLALSFMSNLSSTTQEDISTFSANYLGIENWQSVVTDEMVNFRNYIQESNQSIEYISSVISNDIADGYVDNPIVKSIFKNAKVRDEKSISFEIDKESIKNIDSRNLKLMNLITGEEVGIDDAISSKSYNLELALVEKLEYKLYDGTDKTQIDTIYLPFEAYSENKLDSYSTIYNLVFMDPVLSSLNLDIKRKLIDVVSTKYSKLLEDTKKLHLLSVNVGDMYLSDFETSVDKIKTLIKNEYINLDIAQENTPTAQKNLNYKKKIIKSSKTYEDTFHESISFGGISVEHTKSNKFNVRNILPMYWGLTSFDDYSKFTTNGGSDFFSLNSMLDTFQHNLVNASDGGAIGLGVATVWEQISGNKLAGVNTPMNCEEFDGALCDGSSLYSEQTGRYIFYKDMKFNSLQGLLNWVDLLKNIVGSIPDTKPEAIRKALDKAKKIEKVKEGLTDTVVTLSLATDATLDILDIITNETSLFSKEERDSLQTVIGNYKNVKGNVDELVGLLSSISFDKKEVEEQKYENLLDAVNLKNSMKLLGFKNEFDVASLYTLPTTAKTPKDKVFFMLETAVLYLSLGDDDIFEQEYSSLDKGKYFIDDSLIHQIYFMVNALHIKRSKTVSKIAYAEELVSKGYLKDKTYYAINESTSKVISFLFNGKTLSSLRENRLSKVSNSFNTLLKRLKSDFDFVKFVTKTGDSISHINWTDGINMMVDNILVPMWYSALDNAGTEFRGFATRAITDALIKFGTPVGATAALVKIGNEAAGKVVAMTAYPNKIEFELETKSDGTVDFKQSVPTVISFNSGIVLPWKSEDRSKRAAFLKADNSAPYMIVTKESKEQQAYFLPSHRIEFGTTKELLESFLDDKIDESKFLEVKWNEKKCSDEAIVDRSIDTSKCEVFTNKEGVTNDLSGSYTGEDLDNDVSYDEDEFVKNDHGHASLDYVDILSKKLCEDVTSASKFRCDDASGFMFVYNKSRGIFVDIVQQKIYGAKSSDDSSVDSPEQYTTLFKIADIDKIKLDIEKNDNGFVVKNSSDIPLSLIILNSASTKYYSSYKTYDKVIDSNSTLEISFEELEKYLGSNEGFMDIDILAMDKIVDSYRKFMTHSNLIDTLQMIAINSNYTSLNTFIEDYSGSNTYSFIKKEHITLEKVNHRPVVEYVEISGDNSPAPAKVTFDIKITDEDSDNLECSIKYTEDSKAVKLDSCEEKVSYTYTKDGRYPIEIVAKDENGMETTYKDVVNIFNKNLDVVMLVDLSGSYGDDLSTFRAKSSEIVDAIKYRLPEYDLKIGITSFDDYPISPYGGSGDFAFKMQLDLTNDIDAFKNKLNELEVAYGGDTPEAQLEGIYQTIKTIHWDDNAQKIILFFTDAVFHDKDKHDSDSSYPGQGSIATRKLIDENGVYIIGLASGRMTDDMEEISDFTDLLSSDSSEVVEAILNQLSIFSSDTDDESGSRKIYTRDYSSPIKSYSRDDYQGDSN